MDDSQEAYDLPGMEPNSWETKSRSRKERAKTARVYEGFLPVRGGWKKKWEQRAPHIRKAPKCFRKDLQAESAFHIGFGALGV